MERLDVVVVGAGAVGLAVGRALARAGREVIILDAADAIGTVTSSRNSEVIHAGIYYEPGSLKARLCVRGRDLLYAYAIANHLPHEACGKLIVATSPYEISTLERLHRTAQASGIELEWLDGAEVQRREPVIECCRALYSRRTGIVDSHAFMLQLLADLEACGGVAVLRTPVIGGAANENGVDLRVGGEGPIKVAARLVVNCGGLNASAVARSIIGVPPQAVPETLYAKGNYFSCVAPARFTHLIYPVPERGGLGVHLTRDLAGQIRFGPDLEWVDELDYAVRPERADQFYEAVRRYWPALPDGSLVPAYAGIRPKLRAEDGGAADFRIDGPSVHGVAGLINLFGIESPGLTAALAIGEYVAAMTGGTR